MHTPERTRLVAAGLVSLAAVLIVARVWLLQGLTSVVRIDGGSMAEALPGEHLLLACDNCSRQWRADGQQVAAASQWTCPECLQRVDSRPTLRPGTRVVIDRGAYLLSSPRRFDVVAFHPPGDSQQWAAKRIIALPGESWEIRGGELYIDGKLLRKNYQQFRETATLVAQHCAQSSRAWQPESGDSAWRVGDEAIVWSGDGSDEPDWLTFHSVAANPAADATPAPVQDYDAYNPAMARELNEVADVLAECELAGDVSFVLRVHDGYDDLRIEYDAAAHAVVARRKEREIDHAELAAPAGPSRTIAWGMLDRQLLLVVDGKVILRTRLDEAASPPVPIPTPLSIGIQMGDTCQLRRLCVLRDIYYLDAHRRGSTWRSPAASQDGEPPGYGLLGDNPPLSIDSRHWDHGVHRRQILGRVQVRSADH